VDERDPLLLRIDRNEVRDLLRVVVAYDQRICAEPQAEFLPAGAQGGPVGGLADAIDRAEDGFSAPSRWVRKEALALLALRVGQHLNCMHVVEDRRAAVWELQGDARFEEPLLRVDDVRFGDQDAEALLGRDPLACRLRVGPIAGLACPEKVIQVLAVEAVSFRLQIFVTDTAELVLEDLGERELKNIAKPVQVFRIAAPAQAVAASQAPAPAVPQKPSIAWQASAS
jgi:hypothetical protein